MHATGLRAHAAARSCGAGEHGKPLSWTQPGGSGGHGVPSGLTHPGSGVAYAGTAETNDMPRATTAAPQSSWMYLMNY